MAALRNSSGAQTHSTPAASARSVSASRSATEVPIAATEMRSRALIGRRLRSPAGAAAPREDRVGDPFAVPLGVAEDRRVGAAALEEEVEVVLPGEADAAVDLDRGVGNAPAGVGGVGLRHRGGQRQRLGLGVGGPGGAVDGGAGVLGLQQHLRAAVGDRLVGADRAAELLAVFGVLDRHLHRPLGDPGRLGGERDAEAEEDGVVVGLLAGQGVGGGDPDAVEADRGEAAGGVDRRSSGGDA